MKAGDFSTLAQTYKHRVGYDQGILNLLAASLDERHAEAVQCADIGAGTGKLTEQLMSFGFQVTAVEPNDAMRTEGTKTTQSGNVIWQKGSGESTGLDTSSIDWLTMASAFHWTDPKKSIPEFARVLKPGGLLSLMWNPRDLASSPWHQELEDMIHSMAPNVERRSSGAASYIQDLETTITHSGEFKNVVFLEARYEVTMSQERYMGAWESVNDFPAQVGEQCWEEILRAIRNKVEQVPEVIVPYKTRAWAAVRT